MKDTLGHTKAALLHARRRARERYNVELSEFDILKITDLALGGHGKLKAQRRDRGIFKLFYRGKNFVLVLDFVLMVVVTFLPHKALRRL